MQFIKKVFSFARPFALAIMLIGLEFFSCLSGTANNGVDADDIEETRYPADEFSNLVGFLSPL